MDVAILVLLIILVINLNKGKAIEIKITHKYDQPQIQGIEQVADPNPDDNVAVTNLDEVIRAVNEIMMGGEDRGNNN